MKKPISQADLKQVLSYDPATGIFRWLIAKSRHHKPGDVAGSLAKEGYVRITIDRSRIMAHRLAWLYQTGKWPERDLDHINGVRSDNRFCNLRPASRSDNICNSSKRSDNVSGFKGVSWFSQYGKWQAQIARHGKNKHLGYFATAEEAHVAYCAAAAELHGEFAKTG